MHFLILLYFVSTFLARGKESGAPSCVSHTLRRPTRSNEGDVYCVMNTASLRVPNELLISKWSAAVIVLMCVLRLQVAQVRPERARKERRATEDTQETAVQLGRRERVATAEEGAGAQRR